MGKRIHKPVEVDPRLLGDMYTRMDQESENWRNHYRDLFRDFRELLKIESDEELRCLISDWRDHYEAMAISAYVELENQRHMIKEMKLQAEENNMPFYATKQPGDVGVMPPRRRKIEPEAAEQPEAAPEAPEVEAVQGYAQLTKPELIEWCNKRGVTNIKGTPVGKFQHKAYYIGLLKSADEIEGHASPYYPEIVAEVEDSEVESEDVQDEETTETDD
jgi:hypothetical protein